ncbi:hypothetical protein CSC62_11435 [Pseudoxanthomonas jiangsuensis]|uniref:DUF802 domain-containing protein n=1 Tax=Pseudoxanthomonas jiangsuensis TaxID=619688 RepID=UPI001391DB44|nr:DUF802 domain-containing protein [Pseudoxanthomonas jiangsuensis]KAF1694857.1 hypothetical protein CSC62_11435 [Pseudoxanthomonas jiangsuensis]
MSRNFLLPAIFLAGLAAIVWVAIATFAVHPWGVPVIALVAACYLAGAYELLRYRQATATLDSALDALPDAAASGLGEWLARLHPGLRHPVRLRIEGERTALPGPALTPYLVGLLVLLGMLGTLLGMMATLRGTGLALESATDLEAMRGSLSAPVRGLGFAFGTSIAGVAASAMLGLLSALCRRERLAAVHRLDAEIATTLRPYSQAHQREQAFGLLRRQAELMPDLVERMQAMVAAVERQAAASHEQLAVRQQDFHERQEAAQARLAGTLEHALKAGVAESAQAVAAVLQPMAQATLDGLAREAAATHQAVAQATRQQLDGLASGFERAGAAAAESWNAALAVQREANADAALRLQETLDAFVAGFERSSAALVEGVAARLDRSAAGMDDTWQRSIALQAEANEALVARQGQALDAAAAHLERQAGELVRGLDGSHAQLHADLAAQDARRLEAWAAQLAAISEGLREDWTRAAQDAARSQQAVCATLERSAGQIAAQARDQAAQTIAEIERLVQAASEAPRAAAEVVAELRQKLSDSMVRDTAMLEERTQLIGTLGTLLDAVNHASTEQRGAIDALVATSAGLLEQVGTRFTDHVQAQTGKLENVAAQVAAGAGEVAGLGDAFGMAVQRFGESSAGLVERLQAIEGALERSLARSDEQLAYYVAQAREVIDLSLLSQQQIVAQLQQLDGARGDGAGAA